MEKKEIRIATRGSKLAVYQAEQVRKQIERYFPGTKTSVKIIQTRGDRILDISLSKVGDKGFFTKELENALISGHADVAVHSLKDLPTVNPPGLILGGVLERGEVRDALVSHQDLTLKDLSTGLRIGTSSLRRTAQLKIHFPGITIVDIRGNVGTRIRKMKEGVCYAMVMAAAGLQRLKQDKYIREILDPSIIIPAVSQGAIGMQIREEDDFMKTIISGVNHTPTYLCTRAERTFLRILEGGCQIPIGCFSTVRNGQITLSGFVSDIQGNNAIFLSKSGPLDRSEEVAHDLAKDYLKAGAGQIIEQIKKESNE
ncbi:MAG: hydroxymethylbilane synthase [Bacteroidales bacterium]|nr:hydroxymethylbilane synthase [Bacteroidales bacterium]